MEMSPFQIAESSDISRISSEQFFGVKSYLLGPLISCDESITHHVSNVPNTKNTSVCKKRSAGCPKILKIISFTLEKNPVIIYGFIGLSGGGNAFRPSTSSLHPRTPQLTSPRGLVLDKDRYPLRSVGKPPSSCSHSVTSAYRDRQWFSTKIPVI